MASRFLPPPKREAIEGLYALFRVVDELADDPTIERAQRSAKLEEITLTIERIRDPNCVCEAPWFAAVRAAFARYPIDVGDLKRLIGACQAEADGLAFATIGDLEKHAAAVGGGILCFAMVVLGADGVESHECARELGLGLHLVDIVRDIDEDREIGRNYLPTEYAHLADGGASRVAQRAIEHCSVVESLAKRLPNDGSRLTLLLTTDLYQAMLGGSLTTAQKLRCVVRCIIKAYAMGPSA